MEREAGLTDPARVRCRSPARRPAAVGGTAAAAAGDGVLGGTRAARLPRRPPFRLGSRGSPPRHGEGRVPLSTGLPGTPGLPAPRAPRAGRGRLPGSDRGCRRSVTHGWRRGRVPDWRGHEGAIRRASAADRASAGSTGGGPVDPATVPAESDECRPDVPALSRGAVTSPGGHIRPHVPLVAPRPCAHPPADPPLPPFFSSSRPHCSPQRPARPTPRTSPSGRFCRPPSPPLSRPPGRPTWWPG